MSLQDVAPLRTAAGGEEMRRFRFGIDLAARSIDSINLVWLQYSHLLIPKPRKHLRWLHRKLLYNFVNLVCDPVCHDDDFRFGAALINFDFNLQSDFLLSAVTL